jgi:hypothetical protein
VPVVLVHPVLVPAPLPPVLVSARAPQGRRCAAQGRVCAVPGHLCLVAVVALVVESSGERLFKSDEFKRD